MDKHIAEAVRQTVAAIFPVMMAPPPGDAVLEKLQDKLQTIVEESEEIVALADEEDRDLTEEEVETIEANRKETDRLQRQIQARQALKPKSAGRQTTSEPGGGQDGRRVPAQPRRNDPRGGFRNFGEFAMQVRGAARAMERGEQPDNRIVAIATTQGNEGIGADGGYLVPTEFRTEIWQKVMGDDSLVNMATPLVTGSNSLMYPKDETTPWDTTKGIQVYWESEYGQIAQTKPSFELDQLRLCKLTGLVPVSDELLEDAPGLDSYLRARAPVKMVSKLNTAVIRGTGVGQLLGILNAASLVTVAKETSQAADTVLYDNIVKMWARLWGPCRRNAVWLINQDIEPQLFKLAFVPGATSPVPAYLPANGLSGSPYSSLMGRPVMPVEPCSTLGDLGDIVLVDLTQYMVLTKGQDIKTDVSMHLFFDQSLMAFRFVLRINGKPWWGAAIAPENGSNTRSWAVTLAERA